MTDPFYREGMKELRKRAATRQSGDQLARLVSVRRRAELAEQMSLIARIGAPAFEMAESFQRSMREMQAAHAADQEATDDDNEGDCTHCGGDGTCDANANPLWDCDENLHRCHACGGTGRRRDQTSF